MSEELYFNNELRECLDAAVYSDCGENDQWNYWYQRLHRAHDAAVDRATETQRAENAKLRELVCFIMHQCNDGNPRCNECIGWNGGECVALQRMRELGVEVDG